MRRAAARARAAAATAVAPLRGCDADLWVVYAVKALESFSYFSLSISVTDFLTNELAVDDVAAGSLYGAWGTLTVLYGVAGGPVIDALGVKKSLLVSAAATAVARATLASTRSLPAATAALLGPAAVGAALGVPVLTIGVKRAAPPAARGLAFSLFYVCMNLAALAAGLARDAFMIDGPGVRAYMAVGVGVAAAEAVLVAALLGGKKTDASADGDDASLPSSPPPLDASTLRRPSTAASFDGVGLPSPAIPAALPARALAAARAAVAATRTSLAAVAGPELYKFVAVSVLTINLKQIFRHLDATLPKYVVRAFGCRAPTGSIYAINPLLITIFVPLAGSFLGHWAPFDAVHRGGWVSAAAPLAAAAAPTLAATAAFVVLLSIGEAVWSPRFYDYSMAVAPEGREGLFTALASAPLFAAKLPVGVFSGWLLRAHCPGNGACPAPGSGAPAPPPGNCDGRALWGIIAAVTLTSPAALFLFGRWLRPAAAAATPGAAPYQRVGVDGGA